MKGKLLGLVLFSAMLTSIGFSAEALATNTNVDLYSIMDTYNKKIEQAKADFFAAVKKTNSDAKYSVLEGLLSMDEINAKSKIAIQDAKDQLRSAIQQAREDARENLYMLRDSINVSYPQV